jgi:hypothetical protein
MLLKRQHSLSHSVIGTVVVVFERRDCLDQVQVSVWASQSFMVIEGRLLSSEKDMAVSCCGVCKHGCIVSDLKILVV